jgi:hypothetical protein
VNSKLAGNHDERAPAIIDNTRELIKSAIAIRIANRWTLLQRKMWNVLLYNCYDTLLDDATHFITVQRLGELLEYSGNNSDWIKDSFRAFNDLQVEWDIFAPDRAQRWGVTSALASAEIVRGTICEYSYTRPFRKLLHHPSLYARLDLRVQNRFRLSGALALWEFFSLILQDKPSAIVPFTLDEFRHLMGVDDGYPRFAALKRDVITKCVNEVNRVADIDVDFSLVKKSRAVTGVQFGVKRDARIPVPRTPIDGGAENPLWRRLVADFGLAAHDATQFLDKFEPIHLNELLDGFETKYQNGSITRGKLTAYTRAALHNAQSHRAQLELTAPRPVALVQNSNDDAAIQDYERRRTSWESDRAERAANKLAAMSESEQQDLQARWEKQALIGPLKQRYAEYGLNDALIQRSFHLFVADAVLGPAEPARLQEAPPNHRDES